MHQCNIQRLRFWCFFVMSVATFRVWHRKRSQPRFSGAPNRCYGKYGGAADTKAAQMRLFLVAKTFQFSRKAFKARRDIPDFLLTLFH
jgi:hypothetical protein